MRAVSNALDPISARLTNADASGAKLGAGWVRSIPQDTTLGASAGTVDPGAPAVQSAPPHASNPRAAPTSEIAHALAGARTREWAVSALVGCGLIIAGIIGVSATRRSPTPAADRHSVAATADAATTDSRPLAAFPDAAVSPPVATPPAAAQPSLVVIHSQPADAQVYVKSEGGSLGTPLGHTPLALPVADVGRTVILRREGYTDSEIHIAAHAAGVLPEMTLERAVPRNTRTRSRRRRPRAQRTGATFDIDEWENDH
jgi:hypothetical protein